MLLTQGTTNASVTHCDPRAASTSRVSSCAAKSLAEAELAWSSTRNEAASTFPKYEKEMAFGIFSDRKQQALNIEFNDRLKTVRKQMQRYRWSPTIRSGDFLSLKQVFTWPGRRDSEAFWENFAVFWLMGHVSGSLSSPAPILRFRRCRQCSGLFYALTDHQLQCSAKCRQKFHANSPEFRAKRAAYMRERYRPQEKQRDQRQKRLARTRISNKKRGN
jgi:hypothetical protein